MGSLMTSQWLPIADIAAKVNTGQLKAVDLVEQALKAIESNKEFDAIIATTETRARERAGNIDAAVKNGQKAGRLAGVPFVAKDSFLAYGADSTAGSNILRGFRAPYQATVIERLEAEGAICVAKSNQDAFGHGGSTQNSDFFVTKHPRDKSRVPGGSSGGSAASIMLGIVPFAIGTDTGGSTRQPASFVGCVGYKPTYGLLSRSGVVAMASSTDTVGTFARNVEDAALVIDVMAGKDPLDGTTIDREESSYADLPLGVDGKKVGVIKEWMGEGVNADVRAAIESAVEKLKAAGAEVAEVSLPSLPLSLAAYYIVAPAEISSNLARHDGQRYQYAAEQAADLDESYMKTRAQGFGPEAKRRIMIGTYVLSSGYYDAYYNKAQTVRTKLINEFNETFSTIDFLVGPVAPTTAFKIGENADPVHMYMVDLMTVGASLAGVPSISVPAGEASGLPVGLQIMARAKGDRPLLGFAKSAEELFI